MSRLIDADKVKKYMHMDDFETPDERWMPESEFAALVDSQPTVNAEPVVRCRECMHYKKHSHSAGMRCDHPNLNYDIECFDQWLDVEPNDFCSYGEREGGK